MKPSPADLSAWRGGLRLSRDAVLGLTDLVEALHARIARPRAGPPAAPPTRTQGLTGFVYGRVRGVTRWVGGGGDLLLAALAASLPAAPLRSRSAEREAVLAALNGLLGDHLAATGNPLATVMALYHHGRRLRLAPASLAASLRGLGGKPLVLVHGLCMNDRQWRRDGHDHGAALARDLGYTPLYLRYNTGLPIAVNGLALAQQLETLLASWPVSVREFALLTHSMGGLVARSAIEQGRRAGHAWPQRLDRLACLGTPHHGAPLERGGHALQQLLALNRYSAPFAHLARLRSAGITDLRHGHRLPEDDAGRDRFAAGPDRRLPLPLPDGVACYAIAAVTRPSGPGRWLGDGLVPLDSALGRHPDPRLTLHFPSERQAVVSGIGHLQLLGDAAVYRQLRAWFAEPLAPR